MARKRLTQIFPGLLPLRQWQRKKCCYLKMRMDGNRYSETRSEEGLTYMIFETSSLMVNENSGYDIEYQYNKVHNLKLAAGTMDKVLIKPGETFSFYWLARDADRKQPYSDGLNLADGRITPAYGGGLCQLSSTLYWCFLHTPLTIAERHSHAEESFAPAEGEQARGTDATVSEGWCDLKVRNDTEVTFQIRISFDDTDMHIRVYADEMADRDYEVYDRSVSYTRRYGKIYRTADVWRSETERSTGTKTCYRLYEDTCEIAYDLPGDIEIREE